MIRIEKLRTILNQNSLDGFFINYIPNIRYLSGFSGSSASLLITHSNNYFFTDFRYKNQSTNEVKNFEININYDSMSELTKIVNKSGLKKIGFESSHMTIDGLEKLKAKFPNVEFIPMMEQVETLTVQKLPHEIEMIKKAAEISDKVFAKILEIIKPDITENDISAEITYHHKKLGASEDSFHPIVASGWRGALPHGRATNKVIKKGEMITIDFGCSYEGFCSDITRTVSLGTPNEDLRKIYSIVLESQLKAIDNASAKLTSKQLDTIAREVIISKGYGENFGHGLGHGLGIDVHEQPGVNQRIDVGLKENSVITIEPGIYVDNLGGVRIEDDIVLKTDSCEVLNKSPKELIIL